jgi:transcriptional regulator with XRE-family HTH domain
MPSPQRPTVRARRIGNALRKLRDQRGLTVRAVVRRTNRSSGWLSIIENGLQPIHPDDLQDLLDFYEVSAGPLRSSLLHLAMQGRRNNWQRVREGRISAAALDLASLEDDSALVRTYQPNVAPGLLQTEAYTRSLIEAGPPSATRDVEELIAFRQDRQSILYRPKKVEYVPIVGEAVLHQQVGDRAVMRGQLRQMISSGSEANIGLRILPYTAGALLWMAGSFDILELRPPGELTVAVLAEVDRTVFLEDEADVAAYEAVFDYLLARTLDEDRSLELIERIASDL